MLKADISKKLREFTLDIALEVHPGETLGLLGGNGAGKSTILRIIAGLLKPDDGRIELNDRVIFEKSQKINLDTELRNIGYMFQNYALFPNMTGRENILYGLKMHHIDRSVAEERVNELIDVLHLDQVADNPVTRLSGGQQQRVALARAIAPRPSLLLLDEPLSALDVKTQDLLRTELAHLIRQEKIPCILVTHYARDVLAVADRVCVIDRGRVIGEGVPEEVIYNPRYGFVTTENPNVFAGTVWKTESGAVCVNVGGIDFRTVSSLSGEVTVVIRPEDIILSRERFESSATNLFPGKICKIVPVSGGEVYVYADIGIPLAVAVTVQSVERLNLHIGDTVILTCKATAVQTY